MTVRSEAGSRCADPSLGGHGDDNEIPGVNARTFWSFVLQKSGNRDKELVEGWKGDADGILIFTGLFSATVAAFTIESYKQLQPDSGNDTVFLLTQISQQLAASNSSQIPPFSPPPPFRAPRASIRLNVLWFLSLCLSLTCALLATLMQQWSRNYLQMAHGRSSDPSRQARIRAYVFDGISKFHVSSTLEILPFILHVSLFLFFVGLLEFLFGINNTVAYIILALVALLTMLYLVSTVMPLIYYNFPHPTPLSSLLWRLSNFVLQRVRSAHRLVLTVRRRWVARRQPGTLYGPRVRLPALYTRFALGMKDALEAAGSGMHARALGQLLVDVLDDVVDDAEVATFFSGFLELLRGDPANRPAAAHLLRNDGAGHVSFARLFTGPAAHVLLAARVVWTAFYARAGNWLDLLVDPYAEGATEAAARAACVAPLLKHDDVGVVTAARCVQAVAAHDFLCFSKAIDDPSAVLKLFRPPPALHEAFDDLECVQTYGRACIAVALLEDMGPVLQSDDPQVEGVALMLSEVLDLLNTWQRQLSPSEVALHATQVLRGSFAEAMRPVRTLLDENGRAVLEALIARGDASELSWEDFWAPLQRAGVTYGCASLLWSLRCFAFRAFSDPDAGARVVGNDEPVESEVQDASDAHASDDGARTLDEGPDVVVDVSPLEGTASVH